MLHFAEIAEVVALVEIALAVVEFEMLINLLLLDPGEQKLEFDVSKVKQQFEEPQKAVDLQ